MAAPSGIVWGGIENDYGRIGIYTKLTNTDTQTTASVEIWFWSKYSVYDENSDLYFDNRNKAELAQTYLTSPWIDVKVSTGAGWSTDNQCKIGSKTYTYTRGSSAVTRYLNATLVDVDRVGLRMHAASSFTVPALPTYTISYNANGGSGAPSAQTKKYNVAITISSTKPTRTGYTFQGWATSSSGSVAYAPGASYTSNAGITLYAVWKANTYTISYNANGGSGAPSNQTKTYGVTLKLSTTKPTRANYDFLGWSTSASATTATYAAGGNFTTNATTTLYAVWKLAYVKPRIFNLSAERCNADGTLTDDGTCALITFEWETDITVSSITIAWVSATANSGTATATATGTSGVVSKIVGGSLSSEVTYTVTVTVTDTVDSSNAPTTLSGAKFPIDVKAGGTGVSFGKPAELGAAESVGGVGVADFAFDAKFNGPVYGNVLGLDKLPEIPANADFNNYVTTGSWAVYTTANAETIANIPYPVAGRLEVSSATGMGIPQASWAYLRQRFLPYRETQAIRERYIYRDGDNVWHFSDWWPSSLTPEAAKKVYHTQKTLWSGAYYMQGSHTITLSSPVSEQANGIVLVFSRYTPTDALVHDSSYNHFFIPKAFVKALQGKGSQFIMGFDAVTSNIVSKYLYIYDDHIDGYETNSSSGTMNGLTYDNRNMVLRYVYGV